jgi:hypothetical protein
MKAVLMAAGLVVLATAAGAQSSSRDRDDHDDYDHGGWSDSRDNHSGRDSHDMGWRDQDGGRGDSRGRSRGARFFFRSGDARFAVFCDDRESTRTCVDAALTIFDHVRPQGQNAPR